jgi:long-chain acyl-CoA synthetase
MKAIDWCGALCVPLYDTFGPDAVQFIVQHSDATVIFVASNKLGALEAVLPHVKGQIIQVVVWSSTHGAPIEPKLIQVPSAPFQSAGQK